MTPPRLASDVTYSTDISGLWSVVLLILAAALVVAYLALFIGALVSILRSPVLTGGGKVLWVVVIFVFQLLGPLAWFLWGRHAQLSRPPYSVAH
jgi:hypothetical protein